MKLGGICIFIFVAVVHCASILAEELVMEQMPSPLVEDLFGRWRRMSTTCGPLTSWTEMRKLISIPNAGVAVDARLVINEEGYEAVILRSQKCDSPAPILSEPSDLQNTYCEAPDAVSGQYTYDRGMLTLHQDSNNPFTKNDWGTQIRFLRAHQWGKRLLILHGFNPRGGPQGKEWYSYWIPEIFG